VHVVADGALAPEEDFILPFILDESDMHGRMVRLADSVDQILRQHDYPKPVARLLGEALTLTALLSAALKFAGVFTLQTKGDGPVSLLVCDATENGALRGYAKVDGDIPDNGGSGSALRNLLGEGYLAFTVDQGDDTDRYQGIVELDGETLEECVHHYFRQSQQFQAAVKVTVAGGDNEPWRAGGLMLQRLPADENAIDAAEIEAAWQSAMVTMAGCDPSQLAALGTSPYDLLFNLFKDGGVRVFDAKDARAESRCSKDRVRVVLTSLSDEEIEDMKEEGHIVVTCEFCNRSMSFDEIDLAAMRTT